MSRQCLAQTNCHGALANKDLVGKWVLPGCASEAPEVDGYVIISNHMTLKPHSFADVRITDAETYDLFGEV